MVRWKLAKKLQRECALGCRRTFFLGKTEVLRGGNQAAKCGGRDKKIADDNVDVCLRTLLETTEGRMTSRAR